MDGNIETSVLCYNTIWRMTEHVKIVAPTLFRQPCIPDTSVKNNKTYLPDVILLTCSSAYLSHLHIIFKAPVETFLRTFKKTKKKKRTPTLLQIKPTAILFLPNTDKRHGEVTIRRSPQTHLNQSFRTFCWRLSEHIWVWKILYDISPL